MHWEGLLSRPCSTKEGFLAQPPFSLPRLVQEPYAVSVNGAAKAVVLGQAAPPDHKPSSRSSDLGTAVHPSQRDRQETVSFFH